MKTTYSNNIWWNNEKLFERTSFLICNEGVFWNQSLRDPYLTSVEVISDPVKRWDVRKKLKHTLNSLKFYQKYTELIKYELSNPEIDNDFRIYLIEEVSPRVQKSLERHQRELSETRTFLFKNNKQYLIDVEERFSQIQKMLKEGWIGDGIR